MSFLIMIIWYTDMNLGKPSKYIRSEEWLYFGYETWKMQGGRDTSSQFQFVKKRDSEFVGYVDSDLENIDWMAIQFVLCILL